MKTILLILLIISPMYLRGISLKECFSALEKNYPTVSNQQVYESIGKEETRQLNKSWLPQLFLTSAVSYSSETTEIDIDLPPSYNIQFPKADKDRESISLEVTQQIFDGGITVKQKELNHLKNMVDIVSHQASMHEKKLLTASLFLSAILLDKTLDIMQLQLDDLTQTENLLKAQMSEGIIELSDVQTVQYEVLNLQDKIDEIYAKRRSIIDNLSLVIGKDIEENEKFEIPNDPHISDTTITRMELHRFDLQKQILNESKKLNSRSLWPQLFAGGNLSYGKPGYNMFSDDFHAYYSAGLNLRWQFWDFNRVENKNRILDLKKKVIQNQKAEFELNLRKQLDENKRQISLLQKKAERSQQKITLMESIEHRMKAKLDQGLVTANDYLIQSNKLMKTKTELEQNRLNLLHAEIQRVLLLGGTI